MSEKKKPALAFKELFFAYLAISKLMYWANNIAALRQDELGDVGRMVLDRLLTQDIMIVLILIAMFLLEHYINRHPAIAKSLTKNILMYGIGYVIYITSIIAYIFALNWILQNQIPDWREFLLELSAFYAIACVFLYVKEHLKQREAKKHTAANKSNETTQELLGILHERGVLTQDEYERKSNEFAAHAELDWTV